MGSKVLIVAGALLALATQTGVAGAATTVEKEGSQLVVRGGPETNRLVIGRPLTGDNPNLISVWEQTDYQNNQTGSVTAGAGCQQVSAAVAHCTTNGIRRILVHLEAGGGYVNQAFPLASTLIGGSGDETLNAPQSGVADTNVLVGGAGRDQLLGGSGPDAMSGGAGDDYLLGGDNRGGPSDQDRLDGGPGNDRLDGGLGDDVISGGRGRDVAAYAYHDSQVLLSLDGRRNDGSRQAGERDHIRDDVEDLIGGRGRDVLTGNARPNRLDGNSGNDLLSGGGRGDRLDGDEGDDTLFGGDGDDQLIHGRGDDVYNGGDGRDVVSYRRETRPVTVSLDRRDGDGAPGESDFVFPNVEDVVGGDGNDELVGNSRQNRLFGGPGADALSGGPRSDLLMGGAGDDRLTGGSGSDRLLGGFGLDRLDSSGDSAQDFDDCGPGAADEVTYSSNDRTRGCEVRHPR